MTGPGRLQNGCVPISDHAVAAYREALGLGPTGRTIVDMGQVERLDAFWDARAGRWALTPAEKRVMRACRLRFGRYEPTSTPQAEFIDGLRGELGVAAA